VNKSGIALDIDDTLANTNLFWARYLIKLFGAPEGFTAEEVIEKYRYCRSAPFWGDVERGWVDENKHSAELLIRIPTIPGAVRVIRQIGSIVPIVAYVTSRPASVACVTEKWLQENGFPFAPVFAMPTNLHAYFEHTWKAKVIESMYPNVWGIVDDSIDVLCTISSDYCGTYFLFGDIIPDSANIPFIQCKNWNKAKDIILCESHEKRCN